MSTPLVSVLMTAYNREKYIDEAIESVLASSYRNLELIVVDDCSKDRSVEIARTYAAKDDRVKVYVNETNLGDYPNRNRAASLARGEYIKYADSDDIMFPSCLKKMVTPMIQFAPLSTTALKFAPPRARPIWSTSAAWVILTARQAGQS
jgi:glycosyltransferase involved in cell wall biosynthesis